MILMRYVLFVFCLESLIGVFEWEPRKLVRAVEKLAVKNDECVQKFVIARSNHLQLFECGWC